MLRTWIRHDNDGANLGGRHAHAFNTPADKLGGSSTHQTTKQNTRDQVCGVIQDADREGSKTESPGDLASPFGAKKSCGRNEATASRSVY